MYCLSDLLFAEKTLTACIELSELLAREGARAKETQKCNTGGSGGMAQGTRAQKQEDQLAQLMALLEKQGERQEELAAEQREQQERLQAEQRMLQEGFTEHFQQILTEQQKDFGRMAEKQAMADEIVASLAGDLRAVADSTDERFGAAEAALSELRLRQNTFKADLKEELLQELEQKSVVPQRLRVMAPEFKPAGDSKLPTKDAGEAGGEPGVSTATEELEAGRTGERRAAEGFWASSDRGRVVQQRPQPYDGRTPWDAYRTQFEMLAQMNRWTEVEKATYLAVSLKGSALTILSNLPSDSCYEYATLVAAMEARFGNAHQAELHRMKLKGRRRRREEALPELAEDVERLVRLAYPRAAMSLQELLAKDHFIDALADEDMRLKVRQARPRGLREALQAALELESYQLASRERTKPVRGVHFDTRESDTAGQPPGFGEMLEWIQRCTEALRDMPRPPWKFRKLKSPRRLTGRKVTCWRCGKEGHLQRECKDLPRAPQQKPRWTGPGKRAATEFGVQNPAVDTAPKEVFKTGSALGPCDGLVATGTLDGSGCQITIDTGSNISIIRPDVLRRGEIKKRMEPVDSCLRTVTGEKTPIRGRIQLQLGMGSFQAPHEMWVADISDECILGLDFLQAHGCQVDVRDGVLHVGGEEVPLGKPSTTPTRTCCRIVAQGSITVPPFSEAIISAKLLDTPDGGKWGIVEPDRHAVHAVSLLVGKTLVDVRKAGIPVRVLNLSQDAQNIRGGTVVATCYPVTSVLGKQEQSKAGERIPPATMPDQLERDLRMPVDLLFGRPPDEEMEPSTSYTECLQNSLERTHHFAREHLRLTSEKMKLRYDATADHAKFDKGDAVWLFNPKRTKGVSPNLSRNWHGPFVVTKRINDLVYRIQLSLRAKPKVYFILSTGS